MISAVEASTCVATDFAGLDHPQPETVLRNQLVASAVVGPALLTSGDTAHREDGWLVEESDWSLMLLLAVFDDECEGFVVGVNREGSRTAVSSGVADEPGEAVLS